MSTEALSRQSVMNIVSPKILFDVAITEAKRADKNMKNGNDGSTEWYREWKGIEVPIRDQCCSSSQSEQAIADKHTPVIPSIPILSDVLMIDDQSKCVGKGFQQVAGHVNTNEGAGASHSRQIIGECFWPHFEFVDQHGCHGRCRCIAAAGNHDHTNLHTKSYHLCPK